MITYFKNLFLPIILLLSLDAFSQVADITKGCAPLKVNFTAPATSTTYFWDFKDGVTSNLQNPANIFGQAGIFNVVFRETIGGPIIKTIIIEVFPEPVLNVTATSGCYPLNAQYSNASTIASQIAITKYTWVFPDGTSQDGANLSSITHNYPSKGDYGLSFGIETQYPSCNKAAIFDNILHVYDPPVASFNTTTPSSCNTTLTVGFTNASTGTLPLSYAWDFGNGQTSTALNPPSQTYTTNSYNTTLTVKFAANLAGCQNTTSRSISVGKPVAAIKKYGDTVCLTGLASFKSVFPGIPTWTTDANATVNTIVGDSVSIAFSKGGLHTITLKLTSANGQCFDEKSTTIYVDDITASIQHTPSYSCSSPMTVQYKAISNQSNVKYDWTFADGQTSTLSTLNKTYTSSTAGIKYSINIFEPLPTQLIITSIKTGCKMSAPTALDTLWLPNARMMPDKTKGCSPLTVTFSDSSTSNNQIVSWKWLHGDNTSQSGTTKAPVNHTYTQPGEYQSRLVVTTKRGCIDTSYAITIEVGTQIANLDFAAANTTTCCNQSVTFNTILPAGAATLIDGYHFYTDKNRSFHCSDQKDFTWIYKSAGQQDVSLMVDYNGCFTTVSKPAYLNVKGSAPKIDYAAACASPLKYEFNDENFVGPETYTWDFGDGTAPVTGGNPIHTFPGSGDYAVKVTGVVAASGCPSITQTKIVNVRKIHADFEGDSILCSGIEYSFDAQKSVDVHTWAHNGYNWHIQGSPNNQRTGNTESMFSFGPGTRLITLYVKDINGCIDSLTKSVKIYQVRPEFTADHTQICTPSNVNFTDSSVGDTTLVSWKWNFYDGASGSSTLRNPSYTYNNPANPATNQYYISLTVTDKLGCVGTSSKLINYYKPISKITASKSAICVNETINVSASDYTLGGSNLKYSWDFGNATSSILQSNPLKYTTANSFKVLLNYEELSTGCKGKPDSLTVSVQAYPTTAFKTNVDTVSIICAPKIVSLTDISTSQHSYSNYWDFGNGQTSTQPNFSLVYRKGTYTVKHIVTTSNGCADTTSRSFQLYSPEGNFTVDKDAICKGEVINFSIKDTADVSSFSWAFGDGIVLDNVAPTNHQYNFHPPQGQTIAKLSLIGNEGCNAIVDTVIKIHQVIANFKRLNGIDSISCFNDGPYALTNTSTGASTYFWDFGDGQTSTTQNINTHAYATPGNYDVKLAVSSQSLGCVDTIIKPITIYANPVLTAIGDTVCQVAGSVALNVINPTATSTYAWTPSTGLSSTPSPNPIATIQHSVHYTVVETDINGCTDTKIVPAIVIESIGLRSLDTSIVIGDVITLPVVGQSYYNFTWSPTAGLSCLTCNYPTVQPLEDIIYTLNVKDRRDCYNENYVYDIKIKPETFVKFPTMFTPNGDGNNDVVYVKGWGIKELLEFQIFNRWGQLIYSNPNIHDGWDGTFNGILQNTDIYVYKVKVLTWKNVEIKEEGYINMVR